MFANENALPKQRPSSDFPRGDTVAPSGMSLDWQNLPKLDVELVSESHAHESNLV